MPGPVELALCVVDPGSGARVAVAKVRSAGFGVDGGTLFASLGSDPAETGAAGGLTKSRGPAENAIGGIFHTSPTSAASFGANTNSITEWPSFLSSTRPTLPAT